MNKKKLLILTILASTILGCAADKEQISSTTEKKSMTAPTEKPSAPISMKYQILTTTPKVGENIEVEVSFQSKANSVIHVKTHFSDDKLSLQNDNKIWQTNMNKLGVGKAIPILKVVASENGLYYIRLVANVEIDGTMQAKSFVIPVKVGDEEIALEPVGKVTIDDKQQKVIIQKANTKN